MSHSPTHPPTLALLMFGAAQSASAIVYAPRVTRWLERNSRAWTAVVAANGVAMTIYLWHMTAGVAVTGIFDQLGLLASDTPGSMSWWLMKLPFVAASIVVLALIVAQLARIERRALLGVKADWPFSPAALLVGAVVVSIALKGWTSGNIVVIIPCLLVVLGANHFLTNFLVSKPLD